MHINEKVNGRETDIARIANSKRDLSALRKSVKEILSSPSFKGSRRSSEFLEYVIERSIAGDLDMLKERLIGIELFGRPVTYDTGEDSIVRVTASDVRKRLLQYYRADETNSEFRIHLPPGSYNPQFIRAVAQDEGSPAIDNSGPPSVQPFVEPPTELPEQESRWPITAWILLMLFGVSSASVGAFWWNTSRRTARTAISVPSAVPWALLFNSSHPTHIVTSDPSIVMVQSILGHELSLSDYANHRYIPDGSGLTPEKARICQILLQIDNSSAQPDIGIVASISGLAESFTKHPLIEAARTFQLKMLRSDDNFIFLGSPVSDPWVSFFDDQLDFHFIRDDKLNSEFIRNVKPRSGERTEHIPTANGGTTGGSFAIIAFLRNPGQDGNILLLAGANAEGTAAAGQLVSNVNRFSEALKQCNIAPSGSTKYFEMLLHLNTLAGVSSNVDVVACH